jgi:preprotein translocase subunit SecF
MVELFRNPNVDWIRAKKYLIPVSIILLIIGAISVQLKGFELGVDFSGGTLLTVRFKQQPPLDQIRGALADANIDTNKVTLQPVTSRANELIIRAPQLAGGSETERRVDEDKRAITRALQRLNPEGDASGGKVNLNTMTAEGIEQELRQIDPLGINDQQFATHPYRQVGDQIISFRDSQHKGFIPDLSAIQGMTFNITGMPDFDQNRVKAAIAERFYAGTIDLNLAGTREIEDALYRIDPTQARGSDLYTRAAKAIADYRTNRDGVINSLSEIQHQDVPADLLAKMEPYFTTGSFAIISADIVGPQVGADLRNRAIYVTLAALAGMLIYIAFRFEWIYGVAAVAAVFHDVLVTLGFFSLLGQEIDLTVIAALLTLVGFSMNDTIVIFDRIRENLRLRRRDTLVQLANDSINQTLSRTVITNGTALVSVLAILLFGGDVLRGFALALTIGVVVGTYSTIAVASPVMLWWQYLTGRKGNVKGGGTGGGRVAEAKARANERTLARV